MSRALRKRVVLMFFCAALASSAVARAQSAVPEIYFVPDVINQFNNLNQRPDALAFGLGNSPTPTLTRHYQGIVRKGGAGTPYLFVSRSGNAPPECEIVEQELSCDSGPGNVIVVRMGSRDTSGERLRSNRLIKDWEIAEVLPGNQTNFWPTPPDSARRGGRDGPLQRAEWLAELWARRGDAARWRRARRPSIASV